MKCAFGADFLVRMAALLFMSCGVDALLFQPQLWSILPQPAVGFICGNTAPATRRKQNTNWQQQQQQQQQQLHHCAPLDTTRRCSILFTSQNDDNSDSNNNNINNNNNKEESRMVVVEPGSEGDIFTREQWEDIQESQPSEMSVMKELLGINIFTYVLAALILLFGGLNIALGPGWLGGTLGIQGTGSIEEVSPSLPDTVDLNRDEFLL